MKVLTLSPPSQAVPPTHLNQIEPKQLWFLLKPELQQHLGHQLLLLCQTLLQSTHKAEKSNEHDVPSPDGQRPTEERPHHQQRLACIYLRQSSPGQVRENKESLVNQYQLDALQALLEQQRQEQATLDQQWQLKLERTRYDASLAERRYRSVDPTNRLIASTLEGQWEQALQAYHLLQCEYDSFLRQSQSPPTLTQTMRDHFEHLCQSLPTLWATLPNEQKKLLLRSLIAQVILTPKLDDAGKDTLEVKLVWRSGHFSLLALDRTLFPRWDELPSYPAMLERIYTLWQQGLDDQQIAQQLQDEGFPAYYQNAQLSRTQIRSLRLAQGWSVRPKANQIPPLINGCYTLRGLAIACHTDKDWIFRRILHGTIDPNLVSRHPHQRTHLVQASQELIDKLTLLAAQSVHRPRKPL